MSERLHQVLDGMLPAQALSSREAADLDAVEEAIGRTLAGIRREPAPDLTARVMRRIGRLAAHERVDGPPLLRLWKDAWRARRVTFVVRPGWALACAGVAALLVAGPPGDRWWPGSAPDSAPAAVTDAIVLVQFRLEAPEARDVRLAGDFTGWQPAHALNPTSEGVWTVTVPVAAGVHEYAFVVDGERWVVDPLAPAVADGFGGSNSRLDVVAPASQGL